MCSSLIYSAQPDLFITFWERDSAIRQCLGRLETSHFSSSWSLNLLLPFGHCIPPSGGVWDACAARSKAGPVMGLRPLLGPLASPPKHPLREIFNNLCVARATRL